MPFNILKLNKHQERRLLAGHLWIYSNEVDSQRSPLSQFTPGQLVIIESYNGRKLALAYVNPQCLLCARVLTRDINSAIDYAFFFTRIQRALSLREMLYKAAFYRLIYGESDGLPGLIVDRFGEHLVVQINTAGMQEFQDYIIQALIEVIQPETILLKNDTSMRGLESLPVEIQAIVGQPPAEIELIENDVKFIAPIWQGQKTGWFYDHRDNRARLKQYVKNKTVLDVFSYLGAWGIQAACWGAAQVTCIDSSATAIDLIARNAELNGVGGRVSPLLGDAMDTLRNFAEQKLSFDVIVIDPPAFIKRRKDEENGKIAYQRLNELALSLLNKNGILFSSSCSMHLSAEELLNILRKASVHLRQDLQILEQGHQAPDHPIHPAIAETAYLKTYVARV